MKKQNGKGIAKKTLILYVLKMLRCGSSPARPITFTNMAKVLNSMDIQCDRKTVGRNVDYLIDFGYPIKKLPRGGCYYENAVTQHDFNLLIRTAENNVQYFNTKNIVEALNLIKKDFILKGE